MDYHWNNLDLEPIVRACATPRGSQPATVWPDLTAVPHDEFVISTRRVWGIDVASEHSLAGRSAIERGAVVQPRSSELIDNIPAYIRRPNLSHVDSHAVWLGESFDHDARWNIDRDTHLLAMGRLGSGKSELLRGIFQHCLEHADDWVALAADVHGDSLEAHQGASVLRASGPKQSVQMLRAVKEVIEARWALPLLPDDAENSQRRVMVGINGLEFLTTPLFTHYPELVEEAVELITFILHTGRGAGVHLAAATPSIKDHLTFGPGYQTSLTKEILDHFSAKVAFDRMDSQERQEFIGGRLPLYPPANHKGRAVLRTSDGIFPMQVYATGL